MTDQLDPASEQSFFSHLVELRDRLLRVVLFVLLVFLGTASYANEIYNLPSRAATAPYAEKQQHDCD